MLCSLAPQNPFIIYALQPSCLVSIADTAIKFNCSSMVSVYTYYLFQNQCLYVIRITSIYSYIFMYDIFSHYALIPYIIMSR